MHTQNTRSEFIRLRVQGLSLAGIGRRLGVSKPTVIKWNRQLQLAAPTCRAEIGCRRESDDGGSPLSCVSDEVAALTRRLTALKQELFSRALRDIPTATLETLAGELRQRLETLQPATGGGAPPATIEFHEGKADSDSNERPFADRLPTILPLPGGEGRPVLRSAFPTAIVLLTTAVDEGGGEGPAAIPSFQHSTPPVPEAVRT